ncbi:hypothetical protein GOP47_0009342 [Adiantum capillus-veneris]|uniref:Rieske domain-containing protein n=1 Tax=Adiantum capillus-veneris TaxID=13818 RepID=A0A9D4ZJF4_ADICA|nr:hypothetical protein GOP47_0009342 [Adiantum capillus-veneris]
MEALPIPTSFYGSSKLTHHEAFCRKSATLSAPFIFEKRARSGLVFAAIAPPAKPSENPGTDYLQGPEEGEISLKPPGFGDESFQNVREDVDAQAAVRKFVWKDHWYPVSLIEDLDPSVPTPFQLLGIDLVLWCDREGNWKAFLDKCPHRLAPLSEGRIDENGWLQCSYHGWSFKPDGSCGCIPQANSDGPEAKAVSSSRACVASFPTLVSQGMLFVWPDAKGWDKALQTEPPKLPSVFDGDPNFSTVTIQRDLYYGYDTLMENVSDPSHINFAHHKVTGRRDRAKPLPFKLESSGEWGYSGSNWDTPKITAQFLAPCYAINKIEIPVKNFLFGEQTWVVWICSFNVPLAPGKTRSIVCSARNFFRFLMPGPAWWQLVPRWHEHWTSNKVYDGDMIVLQGQEKLLYGNNTNAADVNSQYTKITFTPTQADRLVLAFRNWLRRHGGGQPDWAPGSVGGPLPSTLLTRKQMLDRFEQHTLKCSSCNRAYETFKLLQKVFLGSAVLFAATAGIPPEIGIRVLLASGAALSTAFVFLLKELEKNFVFTDYVHSKID